MIDLSPPRQVARIIKPRKDANETVHILTCDATGSCAYEKTPELTWTSIIDLVRYLHASWPRVQNSKRVKMALVCHNPHKILAAVENAFGSDPSWNVRLSVIEGESEDAEGCTFYRQEQKRVSYFGFRDKQRHTHYFYPIPALEFMRSLEEYGKADETELEKLLRFGKSLRSFCTDHRLRVCSTRGGLSAQLLKDKKFYPHPRRKVPQKTNEAARFALPGNCYQMQERKIDRFYQSVYIIDQQNAHHFAAQNAPLPHPDSLFAHGWYWNQSDDLWLNYRDDRFKDALDEYGLFRVRVSIPRKLTGYLPPWARPISGDLSDIWLYSNEIQLALSFGLQIRGISRWYCSPNIDGGISEYARWSQGQVAQNPSEKPWLKPALLSAYGLLGARPRYLESAYKRSDKGTLQTYFIGPTSYQYKRVKTKRKIQSPIANVIQRGIIEAETRKLSIELARKMDREGHNVIGIHADAILVENEGQQLPLLEPPWRIKDCLTRFRALDVVSFESDELEILPGRPRSSKEKEQWNRTRKHGNVRQGQSIRA